MFWGTDYEVASDRELIRLLEKAAKPASAEAPLKAVREASAEAWASYEENRDAASIFSFSGDPALIRALRDAWPEPDPRSKVILNTLEQTLAINRLWVTRQAWASNEARASLQRDNFLRHWRAARQQGALPKVMAKFGASHMVRGRSHTAVYDLGTLLPELAALEGRHSFSLMVVPGTGSRVSGLNGATWRYEPRSAAGGYIKGIEPLMNAAFDDAFTLIDLRPLRPIAGMHRGSLNDALFRVIHGFDALLVMTGSTPARELEHNQHPGSGETFTKP